MPETTRNTTMPNALVVDRAGDPRMILLAKETVLLARSGPVRQENI